MAIVTLPLPIQLINGNVADGGQVMTDLNAIASNVNANAAKNGVNNDITALLALTTINPGLTITGATISGSTFNAGTITNSTITATGSVFTNITIIGGSITGVTIDGTTTGVTQPAGTNNTTLATTAFAVGLAFATALPVISPAVANFFVTNNGSIASWSNLLRTGTIRFADSTDTTKRIAFDASTIAPNTTVTLSVPPGAPSILISPLPDFLLFSFGVI